MDNNWDTRQMLGRAASIGAVWGVSKLLETPHGRMLVESLDRKFEKAQQKVEKKGRKARRRAKGHPVLLGAGVAVLAVGLALVARASLTKPS